MMTDLPDLASISTALGWAVIHFAWQGAVVGLIAAICLAGLKQSSAAARYGVACTALAVSALAFVVTFALMLPGSVAASGFVLDPDRLETFLQASESPSRFVDVIAWFWVAGVSLGSLRFLGQWIAVQRLRTVSTSPPESHWQHVFDALREDLGVSRAVSLLRSGLAEAPMVVGWLTPVVLVPASAFTLLTPDQLRSILAHELSHIRRCDHLVNAIQVMIETILFFHPAVWWLSRQVRTERENCSDDVAVRTAGNPRILAEALAQLESLRITHSRAALAANGGPLMNRITRLLGTSSPVRTTSMRWQGVATLAAAAVMTAAGFAHATALSSMVEPPTEAEIDAYLDAVVAKLQEGIDAGRITAEEANAKLDAVRTHLALKVKVADHLDVVAAKLKAGVESGRISSEDAEAKFEAIRGAAADHAAAVHDAIDAHSAAAEIHALVQTGKLTPEQAEAKLAALHRVHAEKAAVAQQLDAVSEELRALVKAGRLTSEDAQLKLLALARMRDDRAALAHNLDDVVRTIHDAVLAGKLSTEEAALKLASIHGMYSEDSELAREYKDRVRSLENAVRAGQLTSEESRKAISVLQQQQKQIEEQSAIAVHHDAMAQAIRSAVEAGELDPEEARAKLATLARKGEEQARLASHLDLAKAKLHEDVLAGNITAEQAEAEIAAAMKSTQKRTSLHNSMKELLGQLKAEVSSGSMTIEEAQAALEALKAELVKSGQEKSKKK